jgi:formylmethanofuran dehydrogenase subunit E
MAFASGKYSQAICDRCGYQYPYLELKKEWNGLFTCPECFEPKHPQLRSSLSRS